MLTMQEQNFVDLLDVKRLDLLLKWCKILNENPRYYYNVFHRRYSFYSRRQSTIDLINKAYDFNIITGPSLFANTGIEVEFFENLKDPFSFFRKCKCDGETLLAYALHGDWDFIRFKPGASMIEYVNSIIPSFYSPQNSYIENLSFEEKGKLPIDPYPHGWLDEHWKIYKLLKNPREVKMGDVVKISNLSWPKVLKCFSEVFAQCKVFSGFFPLSREGYSRQIVTFKTDYEIGLLNALKRLNRTTFIYKVNGIIILGLYLIPRPFDFNISTVKFYDLQEKGYIRDLHVCTPLRWFLL